MHGGIISMNYNSKTLLDVKFSKNVKGYDALEVDQTLDMVIDDYDDYEKQLSLDTQTIEKLKKEIAELKETARNLEVENKKLKKTVDSIPKGPEVNKSNINLLTRISKLEAALYKKGVDPKKI